MIGSIPNILIVPVTVTSLCAGILVVGIVLFVTIYLFTRERLYLAMIFICLLGCLFAASELGIIDSYLLENAPLGRQFHRLQGLAAIFFLFGIPYLLYHLLELNIQWKRINRYIPAIGLCIAVFMSAVAFVSPDLFISQDASKGALLNLRWDTVRGQTGILYNIRDILLSVTMLYLLVCMLFELLWHRRYRHIAYPIAGGLLAVGLVYYDYLIVYKFIGKGFNHDGYLSNAITGMTVFISFSMAGVLRMFIDQTRNIEKAMKIESLGIFAGGIAHDFNNLLTAITGNLSIAQLYCKDNDQKEIMKLLADIEKAASRARDLTLQLLTFSSGGAPLLNVASIKDILEDTAHFVLSGSPVRCEISIADNLKNARVDKGQISQMFHNIILNGMQAMPDGGTISIAAENVRLKRGRPVPDRDGDWIRISIADRGEGIPRQHYERIFDPYFTTKQSGSGLGLTISYSIVKKHNGRISVKSKQGEGTEFEICLPSTEEPLRDAPVSSVPKLFHGGTVILMDDEDIVLDTGRRMLERMGFDVRTVKNGEEAIVRYRELSESDVPPVCVIMDLTIPGGMGGKEAVVELKKCYPGCKAIVSSGYSTDPVVARYRDYGFDGVIIKPYRFDEFKDAIADVLK